MNNQADGLLVLHLVAGLVDLFALARIWSTPSWTWRRGGWSKLAWTVAILWLNVTFVHLVWPLGAILALRQARKNAGKQLPPAIPALPWAEATVDAGWWNVDPGGETEDWIGEPAGVHRGVCSTCGHYDEHWDENVTFPGEETDLGPVPSDDELAALGWTRAGRRDGPADENPHGRPDGELPFGRLIEPDQDLR